MTSYMAQVANAVGIPTLEMHSRKSQAQRDKASDAFRRVNNGETLVTSERERGGVLEEGAFHKDAIVV
jgi:superfamily II DNA/RNA helicase